jgi:hypothetical protein
MGLGYGYSMILSAILSHISHSFQRNPIYSLFTIHEDQSYEQPDDDFDNTTYNNSRIFLFCPNGYITQEKKSDGQVKPQT